jgi:hypothetical protein
MREHTGTSLAIGGMLTAFFAVLAPLIVVIAWLAFTLYALIKAFGSAPDQPSVLTVYLVMIGIVTTLSVCLLIAIRYVGKGMTPGKRRRDEIEPFSDAPGL